LRLGKRVPSSNAPRGVRLDARYHDRSSGGRLEIINQGTEDVYDLNVEIPDGIMGFHLMGDDLPIPRLPSGKSHWLYCSRTMPSNATYFDLAVTGRTASGDPVRETVFLSLGA
jgi:hypothetical protein